jgi:integrase
MPHNKGLLHTKTVTVRGRKYIYFVTARTNAKGKPVLVRLPARSSPQFGTTYAACLAARTRAEALADEMTVSAFALQYEQSPKFKALSLGSQRLYGIYLKQFVAALPTAPANEIERRDILEIADKLRPGAANSFIRTVAALYVWGRKRELVTIKPCDDIDMNDVGEHEPWDESLLADALASDDAFVRLATHLLFYTAQRISDVAAMKWRDIRDERISVKQKKTGKPLDIALHPALADELAKHPKTLGTILAGADGKRLTERAIRDKLKAFGTSQGHQVVPHGLRKNAVNALLEVGCSVAETAAISGQTLQLVEHYARRRNQTRLGDAAILKWGGGESGTGKRKGKTADEA